jgi:hypothetical protein
MDGSEQSFRKRAMRHILLQGDEIGPRVIDVNISLQFESPSITIMPRSLPTHSFATSSPSVVPSTASSMPPCMMPLIHSYSSDIADVSLMIFVSGGSSFLISRGSSGVNVANYEMSVMYKNHRSETYKLD